MVKDNRTWVHPNAIRRGEPGESGKYLHYFRHWESFTLTMDDYCFVRWFASHHTRNFGLRDDPDFDAAAKKLSEQGWDALTKIEKEIFEEQQMKYIEPEAQPDGIRLEGWGRLEGGIGRETITSFAIDNDPTWRSKDFDADYEKTFRKLRVTILSSAEEHPGTMWIWGESMREISRPDDDMPMDEDALYVQFHMLPEKLKTFADEVAAQPMRPTLILNAQGLLFRDEVEAALSEIWHPREYVMIYDHSTPAVLNSISLKLHMAPRAAPPDEEETAIMAPLVDSPGTQSVAPPKSNMVASTVDKQLRGLKHAVWILAAAIVLAALIR